MHHNVRVSLTGTVSTSAPSVRYPQMVGARARTHTHTHTRTFSYHLKTANRRGLKVDIAHTDKPQWCSLWTDLRLTGRVRLIKYHEHIDMPEGVTSPFSQ